MPEIVLHQWEISPFCGKVRRVLEHKQLAYKTINYNGLLARKAAKLSQAGKLPVMDYDGERIADSSAIAAFLESKHPDPPLYPSDPVARAQAQVWQNWADESLFWYALYLRFYVPEARKKAVALLADGRSSFERMVLGVAVTSMYQKRLKNHGLGKLPLERVEKQFTERIDTLESMLANQNWLVGDTRTIADIAVQSQLSEVARTSHLAPQIAARTHLAAWLA
jgi:glutathione S-transferase